MKYRVIGLMSGTSLDGVDLAYITFTHNGKWQYNLGPCHTYSYDDEWLKELGNLHLKNKDYIDNIDVKYAGFLSNLIEHFISTHKLEVDLICSHGHTILHQPEKGITHQIGNGAIIHKSLKIPVVSDFRSLDVELGGQGAPLVPVGDDILFNEYDYCLNLGGFSNFSYSENGVRKAFDICPVNIALNYYSKKLGYQFDKNGDIAKSGTINTRLLNELNNLDYYHQSPPKSLGKEWLEENFIAVIEKHEETVKNKLSTLVEHAAIQISQYITKGGCLVTGGGAYNSFLMDRMQSHSKSNFVLGDKNLIEYKEAMIFGLLGVLNRRNEINCLASVTGAKRDSIAGKNYA